LASSVPRKLRKGHNMTGTIIRLMERQNTMIYNIGLNAAENEDFWHNQNRS